MQNALNVKPMGVEGKQNINDFSCVTAERDTNQTGVRRQTDGASQSNALLEERIHLPSTSC